MTDFGAFKPTIRNSVASSVNGTFKILLTYNTKLTFKNKYIIGNRNDKNKL